VIGAASTRKIGVTMLSMCWVMHAEQRVAVRRDADTVHSEQRDTEDHDVVRPHDQGRPARTARTR
jgi:hypothetical protein